MRQPLTPKAGSCHHHPFLLLCPGCSTNCMCWHPKPAYALTKQAIGGNTYPLPLNVSLEVSDTSPSAGLGHTFYRLNDEEWELFSEPLEATQAGDYTLHYYSTDAVDNIEGVKTASFSAVVAPVDNPELFLTLSNDFSTIVVDSSGSRSRYHTENK